ncbi:AAA family ATPase [Solirubrobacter ginsenosidimutans]|uniref:AAA family ATPase n=1 Tax=Solirubrobacter ginsenosidimutans TaxID=490573 RepID=A0A9X3MPA9_9ACTN|nr:LuxR family transcriptional regulator [Solirubrobacter ginsenosidimutans]MDA0160159.1 AAA family ATPase [Solirubrobacter ginsenosidimutans]
MPRVADNPLVGRAAELDVIDRSLGTFGRGRIAPLVLEGEPGIGKTRLLAALVERADARRCIVLTGCASELERDLPFWVFVDALDAYVAGLDPRVIASLPTDVRSELAHVLPSLSETVIAAAPGLQDDRYRVHRAMRELLERLAARQPLVLVLDDVHWADAASVDLLAALLRSPPDAPVFLVMAARPRQLDERLAAALERTARQDELVRISLGGLSREAAGELLGTANGVEQLYDETGGNPFYLQQLARSQGASGGAARQPGLEAIGVPAAVIASLAEEFGVLSPETQRVLRGAAVSGDPFELDLACAAAGIDADAALEAFDELLALGLVRATEIPRRFRFRHPLVRRAIYESAPGGWRLGAHERAAGALAERGAPATARAHHVEFAARHGDLAAVAVLTEAGTAALLRAPASASRWFGAALRLLPEGIALDQRVSLLLLRARALAAQGRLAESHADLLESIALAPADAVGLRVQLATTCAGVERLLGRHEEAHARLLACLDDLPDQAAADAISLMIELAIDALFGAQPESMLAWARKALELARSLGERPLTAAASAILTLGHAVSGAVAEAETTFVETTRLVAAMPDGELSARAEAVAYLCSAATYIDRYDEACSLGERALRLGRAAGHLHPSLLPALGAAHLMRGRLDEAAAVLDGGVEAARLAGITQSMAWMLRNRSWLSLAIGDTPAALALAEEAFGHTQQLDESVLSAWAAMVLAQASVAAGGHQRAIDVLAGGDVLGSIPGVWRLLGLEALVTAYLRVDRRDEAARVGLAAEEHAVSLGLPMGVAWAQRAQAAVALDAGDSAGAASRAAASIAAAEQAGAVLEAALSRMLAARALAASGDPDGATAALQAAAATFDACGARPHRDAAEQELRKLGHVIHRRSRPGSADGNGLASLTGRERQVAALVVDRRTNQEIANELFLSLKTVETHLRNIFRKLDVSSRVELARAVERADSA